MAGETGPGAGELAADLTDKLLGQRHYVQPSLTQGRQMQLQHPQAKQQLFEKQPLGYPLLQRVTGGNASSVTAQVSKIALPKNSLPIS